jgi:ribosome-associated heat shock protein Hsp15
MSGDMLRIDRLLHFLRLAKTRVIAQKVVEAGHLRIDGRAITRASHGVRVGQVITLALQDRIRVIRVIALPTRRGPAAEAFAHYDDLSPPSPIDDAPANPYRRTIRTGRE